MCAASWRLLGNCGERFSERIFGGFDPHGLDPAALIFSSRFQAMVVDGLERRGGRCHSSQGTPERCFPYDANLQPLASFEQTKRPATRIIQTQLEFGKLFCN